MLCSSAWCSLWCGAVAMQHPLQHCMNRLYNSKSGRSTQLSEKLFCTHLYQSVRSAVSLGLSCTPPAGINSIPSRSISFALGTKLTNAAALPRLTSDSVLLQLEPMDTAPNVTPRCNCSSLASSTRSGTPSPDNRMLMLYSPLILTGTAMSYFCATKGLKNIDIF